MKRITIFLYLLSLLLPAHAIYFKHIGIKEGLSQLSVLSIYQDELGRMWFGTEEGLNLFNGVQITAFKPSLSQGTHGGAAVGNRVDYITGDKQGNLYFCSDNSLLQFNLHTEQFNCLRAKGVSTVACCHDQIWVGVYDSLFIWSPEAQALQYQFKLEQPVLWATAIWIDSKEHCWVGTRQGLYMREGDGQLSCVIPGEDIYSLYEDSHLNLWISTRMNGLYVRDQAGQFRHYLYDDAVREGISNNQVRQVMEDNSGFIWIGTFFGLCRYNPYQGSFKVFEADNLSGSLANSSIFPIYKDRQGTIWLGTYYGGVNYFNPEMDLFKFYMADSSRNDCLSFPFVGKMVEDQEGRVWICTEGGGLNLFDRKSERFTHFASNPRVNSIAHNNLKDIAYSAKRNKLYIGTHTGGLSIFNLSTQRFRNLYYEVPKYGSIAGDRIYQMQIWKDEYLIFTTANGVVKMDLDTEQVSYLFPHHKFTSITWLAIDTADYIWLALGKMVYRVNLHDEHQQELFHCGERGLGTEDISVLYTDSKGNVWLGTRGSGLYVYDKLTNNFKGYTTANSMIPSDYCYAICESRQGLLIVSSDKGVAFFDQEQEYFKTIELGAALPLSGINQGCGLLVCEDGEVFVGGIDGVSTFSEHDIFRQSRGYSLYFSGLQVNNEQVYPNDHTDILTDALPYTRSIDLEHNQNNLKFNFHSNNYIGVLKKMAYEYKLEGFDKQWISTTDNDIQYTNLSPGRYTLILREKNHDPMIEPKCVQLGITIHYPIYATPWAYLLYLLIGLGLVWGYYRFKRSQLLLRTSLAYERKEKEHIEQLNRSKVQFFLNISHEFRTPLTLIISQIDLLLQKDTLSPWVYNKLLKVHRHTHSMIDLISELLDFNKMEQGAVKLKVAEQDLVSFLKEIYLSFYEYAASRSVTYLFTATDESIPCWFDAKQMSKVFYNLLSNAFKYSNEGARIELAVEESPSQVRIKVIDNGVGIKKEDMDKIFNCFYQADQPTQLTQPGTGIGLALTKSIVELHHGLLQVESSPAYGSIFIVTLPKGRSHFVEGECRFVEADAEQKRLDAATQHEMPDEQDEGVNEEVLPLNDDGEKRKVLLVEDNVEVLQVLETLFAPLYQVVLAHNGKEGLEAARREMPDLIVSDVVMPEMTGTEMCMKIKNDFEVCHIPVVLLTALSRVEQNIEGLNRGADAYISKPFNARVLLARCNNLVRNRIILQKKFSEQRDFTAQQLASNPLDQKFIDTVSRVVEENLHNTNFDVNIMAREVGMSRSSLYSKFKVLIGMNPNEFVLSIRLKHAATLLLAEPHLQIAEVSDRMGFGSPRYFARCFKAQFGVTPADYRKQNQPE